MLLQSYQETGDKNYKENLLSGGHGSEINEFPQRKIIGFSNSSVETFWGELLNKLGKNDVFSRVISEIRELNDLEAGWNDGRGLAISKASIESSICFLNVLSERCANKNIRMPSVDPYSTGEVSLTWRSQQIGILNICFSQDKFISYACFFVSGNETHRGKLEFKNNFISEQLLLLIRRFEKHGN